MAQESNILRASSRSALTPSTEGRGEEEEEEEAEQWWLWQHLAVHGPASQPGHQDRDNGPHLSHSPFEDSFEKGEG